MSRKDRNLTAEELALWHYVTRNVRRAPGRAQPLPSPPPPKKTETPAPSVHKPLSAPIPPRRDSQRALVIGASDGIDRRTAQRFARGEMKIDAKLDLHGMRLAEAEAAVSYFIRTSAAADYRCVLVVTGKGRATESEDGARGRIRAETPHWLNRPALRALILAVREAHVRHGGGGALYVLLKRRRA